MNEAVQKYIQNDPVLSVQDVIHYINKFAETPEQGRFAEKLVDALFHVAQDRQSKKNDGNENLMTPEAIYAKFRCEMYNRFMDQVDQGASMSIEEIERWVDRATEFVMQK